MPNGKDEMHPFKNEINKNRNGCGLWHTAPRCVATVATMGPCLADFAGQDTVLREQVEDSSKGCDACIIKSLIDTYGEDARATLMLGYKIGSESNAFNVD